MNTAKITIEAQLEPGETLTFAVHRPKYLRPTIETYGESLDAEAADECAARVNDVIYLSDRARRLGR